MITDITPLPTRDLVFHLAPELRLHLSEMDGQLVVNSREVARVFFHRRHQRLLRKLMRDIWDMQPWPHYNESYRMCEDGSVDITSLGLTDALCHWGLHNRNRRLDQFTHDLSRLVCAKAREKEAVTGVNPIVEGIKRFFPDLRPYAHDGNRVCDDCWLPKMPAPMFRDEVWAAIATPKTFLCEDCANARFNAYRRQQITLAPEGETP